MRSQLSALSLLLVAGSVSAQEGYSAKSLFFGEDDTVLSAATAPAAPTVAAAKPAPVATKKPATQVASTKAAKPAAIGASYFIRLKNADGSTRDVLASRKFKTGERFQLGVKVNRPAYVYILNEAPDGKLTQLYPRPGANGRIDAMGVVFLPSEGAFQFEGEPGTEQLLVYLSPKPLDKRLNERVTTARPDVISAPADTLWSASKKACASDGATLAANAPAPAPAQGEPLLLASNEGAYAAKSIGFSADAEPACGNVAPTGTSASYASKSIAFSEDPAPAAGGQVAAYVVKTEAKVDDSLFLKLRLVHQ